MVGLKSFLSGNVLLLTKSFSFKSEKKELSQKQNIAG